MCTCVHSCIYMHSASLRAQVFISLPITSAANGGAHRRSSPSPAPGENRASTGSADYRLIQLSTMATMPTGEEQIDPCKLFIGKMHGTIQKFHFLAWMRRVCDIKPIDLFLQPPTAAGVRAGFMTFRKQLSGNTLQYSSLAK